MAEELEQELEQGAQDALRLLLEGLRDQELPLKQRMDIAQLVLDRVYGKAGKPLREEPPVLRVVLDAGAARYGG